MNFLYDREYLDANDVVIVNSSHQCNIVLIDDRNFQNFKSGRDFRYEDGGFFEMMPAQLTAPSTGYWNIVLYLPPGARANITYSLNIIKS